MRNRLSVLPSKQLTLRCDFLAQQSGREYYQCDSFDNEFVAVALGRDKNAQFAAEEAIGTIMSVYKQLRRRTFYFGAKEHLLIQIHKVVGRVLSRREKAHGQLSADFLLCCFSYKHVWISSTSEHAFTVLHINEKKYEHVKLVSALHGRRPLSHYFYESDVQLPQTWVFLNRTIAEGVTTRTLSSAHKKLSTLTPDFFITDDDKKHGGISAVISIS